MLFLKPCQVNLTNLLQTINLLMQIEEIIITWPKAFCRTAAHYPHIKFQCYLRRNTLPEKIYIFWLSRNCAHDLRQHHLTRGVLPSYQYAHHIMTISNKTRNFFFITTNDTSLYSDDSLLSVKYTDSSASTQIKDTLSGQATAPASRPSCLLSMRTSVKFPSACCGARIAPIATPTPWSGTGPGTPGGWYGVVSIAVAQLLRNTVLIPCDAWDRQARKKHEQLKSEQRL